MSHILADAGSSAPRGDLGTAIGARLKALRNARGMSVAELARASKVSKAMISRIERAASSPTANVLGRLASGLGVTISELLVDEPSNDRQPLRRRNAQHVWRDPKTGYKRRQLTARGAMNGVELIEVELPRNTVIKYPPWSSRAYPQLLWALKGSLHVTYGTDVFRLRPGDCLSFGVDRPLSFHARNCDCRYLLIINS